MPMNMPSIVLHYRGGDANQHRIDLGELGRSLQGAAKLLGAAAHVAATGTYAKKSSALAFRVLATTPEAASFQIVIDFSAIAAALQPFLPQIGEALFAAARRAIEGIVKHVIARQSGDAERADQAMEVVRIALQEMGHTSRTAIEAVERVAMTNAQASRLLVSPVGRSCDTLTIGSADQTAVVIDREVRDRIEAQEPFSIGPEDTYAILLSELDLKNKSCKFVIREDDDEPRQRTPGEITDPQITLAENPYSKAFDQQKWLIVKAKARTKDDEVDMLFISDVVLPP